MRFSRRRPTVVSRLPTPESAAKAALSTAYGQGVAHGFETTLRLLLGEPADGGVPYGGELPPDCVAWARSALRALDASRRV